MKKNRTKNLICLVAAAVIALLAGCGTQGDPGEYDRETPQSLLESQLLASNENYELKWDELAQCVLLESKKTGRVWSDILYDAWLEGSTSARANSALTLTVEDRVSLNWDTIYSFSELEEEGRITCQAIEDGICVTYYFDRIEIAIPVSYRLEEDGVEVSIDGARIQESGRKYRLVSVGLTPYFCYCANDEENYLFVPSGSGALMYAGERADGTRHYTGEVYGADAARRTIMSITEEEAVRLPVFGAKNGDGAMLGIIREGAGAATIDGQAGYARLGYSNVGAVFSFRGYDTFRHGNYATGNSVTTRVSQERSSQRVAVAFYPLEEEESGYNEMAARYREYLMDCGQLQASREKGSAYSVTLAGGTMVEKSMLGIPYDSLVAMTDFSGAREILLELTEENGAAPMVRMTGYGDNGMLPGTIAGGRRYPSVFGGKGSLAELSEDCRAEGIPLFWDFDIVRFNQSGLGVSYHSDCARTAIHYEAAQYPVTPLRQFDEENPWRIVSREKLTKAMSQALKKAGSYEHSGLCFSSLGQVAYSDYCDEGAIAKAGIEETVNGLLEQAGEGGLPIGVAGANAYAAGSVDVIFDVPLGNGGYDVLDVWIPFYQMIYHGTKPMYSEAVNLSEDANRTRMLAASSGCGLGFWLTDTYVPNSKELDSCKLYGSLYEDNRERIRQALSENGFLEYYEKTRDAGIVRYELLEKDVSATYFENGLVLYANHGTEPVDTPAGKLSGYGFLLQGK